MRIKALSFNFIWRRRLYTIQSSSVSINLLKTSSFEVASLTVTSDKALFGRENMPVFLAGEEILICFIKCSDKKNTYKVIISIFCEQIKHNY